MFERSRKGVLCLFVVVGFLLAAPQTHRSPLNLSDSALLMRAEQTEEAGSAPAFDLSKPESGAVCGGEPDYASDSTPDISSKPAPAPNNARAVFEGDRKEAVMSLIHYPWEELGFKIAFMGSRVGYRAMTLTARRRIEVYLRPGETAMQQAYDLAHELGHAFDLKYNDDASRRKWRQLRGIRLSAPWFGCDACPDYSTPAGDFAETFAFLLLGPGNFHSLIAPRPSVDVIPDLAAFCHIEHLSEVLEAELRKETRKGTIQSARAEISKRLKVPKENRAEAAANMSKSANLPDASGIHILSGQEEKLSDPKSPRQDATIELRHSSTERLFDLQLPDVTAVKNTR